MLLMATSMIRLIAETIDRLIQNTLRLPLKWSNWSICEKASRYITTRLVTRLAPNLQYIVIGKLPSARPVASRRDPCRQSLSGQAPQQRTTAEPVSQRPADRVGNRCAHVAPESARSRGSIAVS
jgi:hypothetical protein